MIDIRHERAGDTAAREALLDASFGAGRFAKTCERLREGRMPANGLALSAMAGERLVGTVRLWHVAAGHGRPALMLGPLAVASDCRALGLGGRLMHTAIEEATLRGHDAILLVGDAPYYTRFGFHAGKTAALTLPGPYERDRFLALELACGALDGARGLVRPTGERVPSSLPAIMRHPIAQAQAHAA